MFAKESKKAKTILQRRKKIKHKGCKKSAQIKKEHNAFQ